MWKNSEIVISLIFLTFFIIVILYPPNIDFIKTTYTENKILFLQNSNKERYGFLSKDNQRNILLLSYSR